MHDIALEVADVGKGVRHVSLMNESLANCCFTKAHIRTYLKLSYAKCREKPIKKLVENYRCVRALDLSSLDIKSLPTSIGKLIHLRYLDLSENRYMEVLPKSFTKLYNLQTLNLNFCEGLKELPTDFCKLVNLRILNLKSCRGLKELPTDLSKLVNLRILNLEQCDNLTDMPSGLGKMTNLYQLFMFVVGERNSSLKQHVKLEGLKALKELRGSIGVKIHFPQSGAFVKDDNVIEGAYMKDKEHLYGITFECIHKDKNQGPTDYEEKLFGHLQPHSNLKELLLVKYQGVRMPSWASFLPNLVRLELYYCTQLRCLASLGKLYHLKYLTLAWLTNLEYVDLESQPTTFALDGMSNSESLRFSPSLEELTLLDLPKLKGINSSNEPHQSFLFLSQLKWLFIRDCPVLTYLPDCSNLETLDLRRFNERLRVITNSTTSCPKLREVEIDNLAWLHSSLPIESLQSLSSLELDGDKKVESLSEFGQVFRACSSSLRTLKIYNCPKLWSLLGGLGYLGALENLTLRYLPEVKLEDEEIDGDGEGDGMPWGSPLSNPNGEDWPNIQHIPHIFIRWETDAQYRQVL